MDINRELIWYWYIFENRTLQDTHHRLSTKVNLDFQQNQMQQGMLYSF